MKRKGAKSPHSKISHILLFMPASPPSVCRRPLMPPSRTAAHEKRKGGGFPFLFPIMFPFGRSGLFDRRRTPFPVQKGKCSFFSHFLLRCGRTTLSQRKRRARAIHKKGYPRSANYFPPPLSRDRKKLYNHPFPPMPASKRGGGHPLTAVQLGYIFPPPFPGETFQIGRNAHQAQ